MTDRHSQALAELAELGMALARKVQARALAAPDDEVAELTLAFHRVSRSVRQTFALESRLERERRAAEREGAAQARRETLARVQRKRAQVRNIVAREIWTESEGCADEAEALLQALDGALMDEGLINEAFAEAPLEAAVARIRADLGLAAAAAGATDGANGAGPAPASNAPNVIIWRSSP